MNKYQITVKGKGTKFVIAPTPMRALNQIHSMWPYGVDFMAVDKKDATIRVELLGGSRESVNYYKVNRR